MADRTIIKDWQIEFIQNNSINMNDKELCNATGLILSTVKRIRVSNGIFRNVKNDLPDRRKVIGCMLEDYWCNYTNMQILAKRYSMDTSNISRQIQHLFKLPLNNFTEVITMQSKINES